jgi:SagB-type dehydrogenase family enzyme
VISKASAVALLALACCTACDAKKGEPPETRIRPLNEIPMEQLRVVLKGFPGDWRADGERSRQQPEPPAEKPVPADAKRIALVPPGDFKVGAMPLQQALATRRSVRSFSSAPLTLEELSFLLWAAQGVTAVQEDDAGQVVERFRTAPSAGARYPLETYVAVNRVADVAPGLYRYRPSDHQLILVREDANLASALQSACYEQPFVGEAAAVFIWSAIPYRTEWKYVYLSHRMIAMEAGHACQNLYLAAQSCGAGACAVMAYHQPRVDELIGADGQDEFALYLACAGKPAPKEK